MMNTFLSKQSLGGCALRFAMLLTCVVSFANAHALTFSKVPDVETIATKAPLAFRGVVQSVEYASASMSRGSYPYTVTTFQVLVGYRGVQAGEEVRIARMGGPIDGDFRRYLMIPGVPSFAPGDEVVMFHNDQQHPFFGASFGDHGVLRVAQINHGARQMVTYSGHPISELNGKLSVVSNMNCAVRVNNNSQCSVSDLSMDEHESPSRVTAAPLSPEDFDERIKRVVDSHPLTKPALTISGDIQAFEMALKAAFDRDESN